MGQMGSCPGDMRGYDILAKLVAVGGCDDYQSHNWRLPMAQWFITPKNWWRWVGGCMITVNRTTVDCRCVVVVDRLKLVAGVDEITIHRTIGDCHGAVLWTPENRGGGAARLADSEIYAVSCKVLKLKGTDIPPF